MSTVDVYLGGELGGVGGVGGEAVYDFFDPDLRLNSHEPAALSSIFATTASIARTPLLWCITCISIVAHDSHSSRACCGPASTSYKPISPPTA